MTLGTSSSVMETVASAVAPGVMRVGRDELKPSFTLSPSSSAVSWVAVKVISFSVSPALNTTLLGTL